MDWVNGVFGQGKDLSIAQECARALLVFAYGFAAVRIVGRRVFGKWAALDIVVSIIVGSSLSRTLTGSAPMAGTLGATTLLLTLHWCLAQAACRHPSLSRLIEGRSYRVAHKGERDLGALHRWSISEADIAEALRQKGLTELSQADEVILEPSGGISVLKGS